MGQISNKQYKIAIIGGGYLQLPLVTKCKQLQIETHCFSWADGAVCKDVADYFYPISIIEKEQILEQCQKIGIDAITTIASDVAVITVNYIADKMGLIGNPMNSTGITTNKFLMRQALSEGAVPCPRFIKVPEGANIDAIDWTFPVIVKPTDRSGSRGVTKVESKSEITIALKRAQQESFSNDAIVEEFVEGREISIESISYRGQHWILQITDKETTGAPYFVETAHHQPADMNESLRANVIETTLKALNVLNIQNGASHTEMKIDSAGNLKIIEVGARMGGDFIGSTLVELSTGYDFLKGVIDVALGRFNPPAPSRSMHSGVYFLSGNTPHVKHYIENAAKHPEIIEKEITDTELHHIRESADRSGYFIYQAEQKFICN